MATIKEIFTAFAPEYLERFGSRVPANHIKVVKAIKTCRTHDKGIVVYSCKKCNLIHTVFRSCGNRHCPTCQNHKTREWLRTQEQRLVPGHYFMITFTVPDLVRGFVRSNQKVCYNAMFKASSSAIRKLCTDKKLIGGNLPGFFGVLHTWGRQLQYHPHIHYIVPGGAFSATESRWHPSRRDFYLPVRALSKLFKAVFLNEIKQQGLIRRVPFDGRKIEWNVDCQPIGDGIGSLKYLAPYVFKVAITNSRIVKVEDRTVTFRYKKQKSNRWRSCCLDVMEFIRRYLQHVLPTGFMKVRYYGFMHPCSAVSLDEIRLAIKLTIGKVTAIVKTPAPSFIPTCPDCGGELKYLYSILPFMLPPKGPG